MQALGSTVSSSAKGLVMGTLVALACCSVVVVIPRLKHATTRLLTLIYCIPLAAIAPLLFLLLKLPGPHVVLGAIAVVFPVYISLLQGLMSEHQDWSDLARVLGGPKWLYFLRVRVPACTREMFVAAKLAGPAAILGTTLAEYFGGTKGVGVLMINSLAQVNAPRAYALGAVVTIMCAALYFSVGLLSRLFPWVGEV